MQRFEAAKRASILGIVGNVFLFIIKIIIGIISNSQAMIADAFNSASDILSSFMTYIGKVTMGIYVIDGLLIFPDIVKNMHEVNYWIVLIESLYKLAVCLLMIALVKKNKTLNRLLSGAWS